MSISVTKSNKNNAKKLSKKNAKGIVDIKYFAAILNLYLKKHQEIYLFYNLSLYNFHQVSNFFYLSKFCYGTCRTLTQTLKYFCNKCSFINCVLLFILNNF